MTSKHKPQIEFADDGCDNRLIIKYGHFTEEEVKKLIPGMIYEGEKIIGIEEYGYLKHVFLSEDEVQELDADICPDKYGHYPGWEYISKKPGMAPLSGVTTKVTVLARD